MSGAALTREAAQMSLRKTDLARKSARRNTNNEHDSLVPDHVVRQEVGGVSRMSLWRWDRDPAMAALGWPPGIELNGRRYRSRQGLEAFKANLMRQAIAARGKEIA
jgi:hypothetical protein